MYRRAITALLFMLVGINCYATQVSKSMTQFNIKCPAQRLGPVIDNYYHECRSGIVVRNKYNSCEKFIEVFKELMPEYDCARDFDITGEEKYIVPAIWLLGDEKFSDYHALVHDLVFEKMYSSKEFAEARKEASALFFSKEFRDVLDAGGEEYEDEWEAHEQKKK
jgi:hypothetical protein